MVTPDERLRALERRWRASGELEDEVAWLGERLRSGQLSQDQIGLAAYLGSEAARGVWDPGSPPPGPGLIHDVVAWRDVEELRRRPRVLAVVYAPWSWSAVMVRRAFGDLARLLEHLSPAAQIFCCSILPDEFGSEEAGLLTAWFGEESFSLTSGNGDMVWIQDGSILEAERGLALSEREVVERTVRLFELGIDP